MNNQIPSRIIMWNVQAIENTIVMYGLFAISLVIAAIGLFRHYEFWMSGNSANWLKLDLRDRVKQLLINVTLQKSVVREKSIAVAHSLVYLGFLILTFTTTMVMVDHDFGIKIYNGNFYLIVTILSDMFGFGVLIGVCLMAYRRYLKAPDHLHSLKADSSFLIVIAVLIIQGFLLEGLRIKVTEDPWRAYSPIGNLVAHFFWFLSDYTAMGLHFLTWWFHTISVFAVFALMPYTKFFHIIASSINLYFKPSNRAKGQLNSPGDLEAMMEKGDEFTIGFNSIKDYTWKNLLDLDACTSCGRCQDVCPAYNSGKMLSPKWLILDTRNHALTLNADNKLNKSILPEVAVNLDKLLLNNFLLKKSGLENSEYINGGTFRGKNNLIHKNVKNIGVSADAAIAGDVIDPETFWSCVTCNACVEVCPVGINHVDQIIENRRNLVLMRGEVPTEAQATLRSLETRGNPFGAREDRIKWAENLEVPLLKEGDEIDYLYWVGCVSSYDSRKQKIAKSLVKILNKAGISYGILGNAESCTGDPARRLGEEMLFQTLVKQNIKTLNSIKFNKIVTNCPHCFNSLKNEYSDFGKIQDKDIEILHHSQLIQQLIKEERITLSDQYGEYAFHDPCYLGRYNDEYEAPRDSLKGIKSLKVLEMKDNKQKGMCCGAGGGHFWMDIKKGERINSLRVLQAAETGADKIATACPFCLQMMEDGVKLTDKNMEVKDIAEVVADALI